MIHLIFVFALSTLTANADDFGPINLKEMRVCKNSQSLTLSPEFVGKYYFPPEAKKYHQPGLVVGVNGFESLNVHDTKEYLKHYCYRQKLEVKDGIATLKLNLRYTYKGGWGINKISESYSLKRDPKTNRFYLKSTSSDYGLLFWIMPTGHGDLFPGYDEISKE